MNKYYYDYRLEQVPVTEQQSESMLIVMENKACTIYMYNMRQCV